MELSDLAPFAQLSAVGALLFVIVLLIRTINRGDWVPRRELDYLRADRDARLAEKDREIAEWRGVAETERTGREVVTEQNRELIASVRITDRFFDTLRALAEGKDHAS